MIILLFIGDSDEDEEVGSQLLRKQRRSFYVMFLRKVSTGIYYFWKDGWCLGSFGVESFEPVFFFTRHEIGLKIAAKEMNSHCTREDLW